MSWRSTSLTAALVVFIVASCLPTEAAFLRNVPQSVTQPDGAPLECYASGDEFYNWLHDANGYVIIQDPTSGYYVYAIEKNGKLEPSAHVAGTVADPASVGLVPDVKPEREALLQNAMPSPEAEPPVPAPSTGVINNIAVFIRFAGESEFTDAPSTFGNMFNAIGANSLRSYFQEASYQQLTVSTTLYPTATGSTVLSFQDSNPRGYYQPYNAVTNPGGYQGGDNGSERTTREHTLLANAINFVKSQIPAGLAIDGDGDGNVDNVCFIVSGSPTGWASLLWPHAWALYTQDVRVNGKRVYTYNLQLRSSLLSDGAGVLAHEMFHSIGAPDLYHYSQDSLHPVWRWDLMEYHGNPPVHMGAHMKLRYGKWIASIPSITTSGTYTLSPLTSPTGNCYKIASPRSTSEYFLVEYRRKAGLFESSLPGSGLIVYRINTACTGNNNGPPDEVYIYRPSGSLTSDGFPDLANFSSTVGRTAISDLTSPCGFLSNGTCGGLDISSVGAAGETISFAVNTQVPTTVTISGYVRTTSGAGIMGVVMSGLPGTPSTNVYGGYSVTVAAGWSGTVTPVKSGYWFTPASKAYTGVTTNQAGQDYVGNTGPATVTISGQVRTSGLAGIAGVSMVGLPGTPVTSSSGTYSVVVATGWSGTVTPAKTGYTFSPISKAYTNITTNQTNQDYVGTLVPVTFTISGHVRKCTGAPVSGVVMNGLPGTPSTDADGAYTAAIPSGWSGTVTPSKAGGWWFVPESRSYSNVTSNQVDQDYIGAYCQDNFVMISGHVRTSAGVGIPGVTMNGLWEHVTDAAGYYEALPCVGWFGTVTPGKTGYTFTPPSRSYCEVNSSQTDQDYVASGGPVTYTVSGHVRKCTGVGIAGVVMSGLPGSPSTDADGAYTATVPNGWSGTVTPSVVALWKCDPQSKSYSNVTSNQVDQDYTGARLSDGFMWISGHVRTSAGVGISGVAMNGLGVATDASGAYSQNVRAGWFGTVTPTKAGYTFTPPSRSYCETTGSQDDYVASGGPVTISGYVRTSGGTGIPGVVMNGLPGSPSTGADGAYSAAVTSGWSGTVTPTKAGLAFTPASRTYTNVTVSQTNQNYTTGYVISGYVRDYYTGQPVEGVTISGLPGNPVTNASGFYSVTVARNWSGTAIPLPLGDFFIEEYNPRSLTYTNVVSSYTNQNYTWRILL